MTILSIADSAIVRKQQSTPTGEADLARKLSEFFSSYNVSLALHRYEFSGLRGSIDIQYQKKEIKSNAIFWYEKKIPRITLFIGEQIKVISLIGRKDQSARYTKFSVLKSRLNSTHKHWSWVTTKPQNI